MTALRELALIPTVLRAQYLSRATIEARQQQSVERFLTHAQTTVPYYRERHGSGTVGQLSDIGPLAKSELRSHGPEPFLSELGYDLIWTNTSGTTGARLRIAHDRNHFAIHNATCLRRFLATGVYRPWHRLLHYRPIGIASRWYQRLGLFRRTVLLSSLEPRTLLDAALRQRPQTLIGYPTTLRDLGRRMTDGERCAVAADLRVVFTESEMLIEPHRREIEELWGAPVFDEYSAYEVLNITFECSEHSNHISEDRILLEVLDDDGAPAADGTEGDLVVTAFHERAMPLIRYAIGDRGRVVPGPCRCGRTFRRLELTGGRRDQQVTLPDGSVLSVGTFLYLAAEQPGVAESMVRQDDSGAVTIHLVTERDQPFDDVAAGYLRALYGLAGRKFPAEVVEADTVHLTEGGKGRFLESSYRPTTDVG